MTYDYIIVGAGSAGCILAERLSASGQYSVLVLEAGGKADSFWFKIPVGFAKTYYDPGCNWMYYTEPEAELANRKIYAPRGKVQGGSGSINAMIYVRGAPRDFDDWAAAGNSGWSYRDVLPYFRKLETHEAGNTAMHGASGPIHVTSMKRGIHAITRHFLDACDEMGIPRNDDFNGEQIEGVGVYDVNTHKGQRASSNVAYLEPALKRSNVHIEHHAPTSRVLFDGLRATGVEVSQNGVQRSFHATREVLLCAGAVDTPKLLQLSGVGPKELLARHGISLVHALPAVGQNLQDHLCASYYYRANMPTLNGDFGSLLGKLKLGLQYLLTRKGPLAMSVNQAGGFFNTDPASPLANMQLYFNPLSYRIPKSSRSQLTPEPYPGFLLAFNPCRPTSRGSIEIASANAKDAALIHANYLSTQKDIDEVIQGSRLIRAIMQAPALRAVTVEETLPGASVVPDGDDAAMLQYFRDNSGSIYHLCGSCAMGPDPQTAVVDSRLRVHGLQSLRIVDASIFPNVTSGNINAPVMMVAEKAAQMILDDATAPSFVQREMLAAASA
ncbi:choline dehydrogenase [Caballeronia mineralivorans PML1(12)]|uniref:Choline dehydrogenase n=1 Tax=Caballeronia mineralivorans PML1(12) TaxID=908627 RepID=A0A0J1CJK8_9BURK|nr:GMC family oxidoreductase N-terminal domain-containing protein [Caballeronia mineralivorans]KLU20892.1 choline dehydrogenase [Caballeronia mineralivorans PML1(12)]